jgi:hypothetical protein
MNNVHMYSYIGQVKSHRKLLLALGISQTLVMVLTSGPGADIALSRQSFLIGENSDFLGIFAGWFYSLIPNQPLGWGINMTFIQMILVVIAFQVELFKTNMVGWKIYFYPFAQYFALYFSAQQSRDGALFALVFFGFSVLRIYPKTDSRTKKLIILSISLFFIVLGLCFRPWMFALALPLVVFALRNISGTLPMNKPVITLFSLVVTILPMSVEYSFPNFLEVKREFPLQTLLIHDLTTSACWSANIETAEASLKALENLSVTKDLPSTICQFYKPNTWQAVTGDNTKSRLTSNLRYPLSVTKSPSVYENLFQDWVAIIVNDPKTYIQNKLMLSAQVYLAAQTRISRTPNFDYQQSDIGLPISIINGLVLLVDLPWKISSVLFFFTPGVLLISYFTLQGLLGRKNLRNRNVIMMPIMALVCTIWGTITFVSDNARYLSSFVILTYYLVPLTFDSKESKQT